MPRLGREGLAVVPGLVERREGAQPVARGALNEAGFPGNPPGLKELFLGLKEGWLAKPPVPSPQGLLLSHRPTPTPCTHTGALGQLLGAVGTVWGRGLAVVGRNGGTEPKKTSASTLPDPTDRPRSSSKFPR